MNDCRNYNRVQLFCLELGGLHGSCFTRLGYLYDCANLRFQCELVLPPKPMALKGHFIYS